jgi:hypothetical protein
VISRKLAIAAAGAVAALGFVPGAAHAKPATGVAVCNEAENSWQGDYDLTTTDDPNPPAFLRGVQMALGNGHGKGLVNAAAHSPAKVVCGDDGSGDGGDGGSGLPAS